MTTVRAGEDFALAYLVFNTIANLLEHRWADWDRSVFTAESRSHVSVYRLPV